MEEKTFEDILSKYPQLIEDGLVLEGRQVTIHGRRMDLVFKDTFGRQLIVELKAGPIKDAHIGQIMSYEGSMLSHRNPDLRIMLVGTRVPSNIRKSLDHHGIAWKEISEDDVLKYLDLSGNTDLLPDDGKNSAGEEDDRQQRGSFATPAKDRNLAFWKGFLEKAKTRTALFRDSRYRGAKKPTVYIKTTVPQVTYCIRVAKHLSRVNVYIMSPDSDLNKRLYNRLLAFRKEVEREFGDGLVWDPKPEKKACEIYKELGRGVNDTDKRDELYEQMIETMLRLEKAFRGLLGSMPA